MIFVPVLIFFAVLVVVAGTVFFSSRVRFGDRDVKKRLALLETERISNADIPDALKQELLSNVPLLNRFLSAFDSALRVEKRLRQAGLRMKAGTFAFLTLGSFAAGVLFGTLLHAPVPLSVLVGVLFALTPNTAVNVMRARRRKTFTAQFPDALEMFSRSLRAGHAFTGAIQLVAQEMPDPTGIEFRQVFDEQNLGVPLREALSGMAQRVESLDVKFFVTAILIQRETGGNLAEIIDKIAHVIRERFRIQGQVKVFTAQARMTGTILALLPVAVAVAIGIINPDYLKPLWLEKTGRIMVAAAVVMQIAGGLAIRKIIRIKI